MPYASPRPSAGGWRIIAGLLFTAAVTMAAAQPTLTSRQFPIGSLSRLDQLPAGPFRTQLEQLPAPARERARQWLNSFHFTEQDLPTLRADANGGIFYVCERGWVPAPAESDTPPISAAAVPVSPFQAHLIFHSRPGAANVLFIEFSGMTVTNTESGNSDGSPR